MDPHGHAGNRLYLFPLVPPLSFLCALGAALLFRALSRLSRRPSRRLNYA